MKYHPIFLYCSCWPVQEPFHLPHSLSECPSLTQGCVLDVIKIPRLRCTGLKSQRNSLWESLSLSLYNWKWVAIGEFWYFSYMQQFALLWKIMIYWGPKMDQKEFWDTYICLQWVSRRSHDEVGTNKELCEYSHCTTCHGFVSSICETSLYLLWIWALHG